MEETLSGTLQNLVDSTTLHWIFVGGKGGVGKTTTSSSLSILFASKFIQSNKKVLIISTDPAHNLSDCFDQKFSKELTQVNGFQNLYAIEIDPNVDPNTIKLPSFIGYDIDTENQSFLSEIVSSIPGIDEAMSFAEMVKQELFKLSIFYSTIESENFELVVFDTAPTGHTLRLLNFPNLLDKAMKKIVSLQQKLGDVVGQVSTLIGGQAQLMQKYEMLFEGFQKMKTKVEKVNDQLKDCEKTTFVCVCIPEFLSLYENERLVQELAKFNIDVKNIVINQVVFPDGTCKMCKARNKMQYKYIEQILELYSDFHIVVMPQQEEEVRGIEKLKNFGSLLLLEKEAPNPAKFN